PGRRRPRGRTAPQPRYRRRPSHLARTAHRRPGRGRRQRWRLVVVRPIRGNLRGVGRLGGGPGPDAARFGRVRPGHRGGRDSRETRTCSTQRGGGSPVIVCRKCGFHNGDEDTFCGSCGAFLEWTGDKIAPKQAPAPEPEPEPEPEPAKRGFLSRVQSL